MIDIVLLFGLTDLKAQIAWVEGVSGSGYLEICSSLIKPVHSGRKRGLSRSLSLLNVLHSPSCSTEVLLRSFMIVRSETFFVSVPALFRQMYLYKFISVIYPVEGCSRGNILDRVNVGNSPEH